MVYCTSSVLIGNHKHNMCTRLFLDVCTVADFEISFNVLNKTVIPLALVGYDIVISQLMLRASLASIIFY